jgi:hypothetical protein
MLYKAETAGGGEPARCDESTQDTSRYRHGYHVLLRANPGSARRKKSASSAIAFTRKRN